MAWSEKIGIFYDAEFTGLHRDTSLISIGFVSQSGATFYGEFSDYNTDQLNDFLRENVIKNLKFNKSDPFIYKTSLDEKEDFENHHYDVTMKGDYQAIKLALKSWLKHESLMGGNKQIQFFTDCYAYDWVLLNDLISDTRNAIDIPDYIYYIPIDLSTLLYYAGVDPDVNREEFIGELNLASIKRMTPFIKMNKKSGSVVRKHNALWDAYVAAFCYSKIYQKEIVQGQLSLLVLS